MRHIDKIIADVEQEIGILTQEKTASVAQPKGQGDDDILALAAQLSKSATATPLAGPTPDAVMNMTEKVAHSIAIVDTLLNMQELVKMAEFEKAALARGFSQPQIEAYMAKTANAKASGLSTIANLLRKAGPRAGIAAGAGGLGLAGGASVGHKKGEEQGYGQALDDVNRAFQEHAMA